MYNKSKNGQNRGSSSHNVSAKERYDIREKSWEYDTDICLKMIQICLKMIQISVWKLLISICLNVYIYLSMCLSMSAYARVRAFLCVFHDMWVSFICDKIGCRIQMELEQHKWLSVRSSKKFNHWWTSSCHSPCGLGWQTSYFPADHKVDRH